MTYSISGYVVRYGRKNTFNFPNVEADSKEQAKRAVLYEHPGAVITKCKEAV